MPLYESVGLGSRELVSIVGAGGKTTILHTLGTELAAAGYKVILTTTTKMAPEQTKDPVIWSDEPTDVERSLTPGTPLFVLAGKTHNRVTGPTPASIFHRPIVLIHHGRSDHRRGRWCEDDVDQGTSGS